MKVRIEVAEGDVYNLSLKLAHQINVQRCFTKVYGSKVNYYVQLNIAHIYQVCPLG